jgi:hypothetical protein
MLSKCANPACSNTFRYFREGRLFLIESQPKSRKSHSLEYFWLCSSCCRDMTLQVNDGHAVTVFRKQRGPSRLNPSTDAKVSVKTIVQ